MVETVQINIRGIFYTLIFTSTVYLQPSFTNEMNLMLQNETTKNNLTVKGMAPIRRSTPYGNS